MSSSPQKSIINVNDFPKSVPYRVVVQTNSPKTAEGARRQVAAIARGNSTYITEGFDLGVPSTGNAVSYIKKWIAANREGDRFAQCRKLA